MLAVGSPDVFVEPAFLDALPAVIQIYHVVAGCQVFFYVAVGWIVIVVGGLVSRS